MASSKKESPGKAAPSEDPRTYAEAKDKPDSSTVAQVEKT
jgi:hypothetical protein